MRGTREAHARRAARRLRPAEGQRVGRAPTAPRSRCAARTSTTTLRLVAEVLREPSFPAAEFEELKRASLTGAETQRSDPSAIAGERLARHLNALPARPLALRASRWTSASPALKAATLADAKRCYAELVGATGARVRRGRRLRPRGARRAGRGAVRRLAKTRRPTRASRRAISSARRSSATVRDARTRPTPCCARGLNLPLRDDDPDFPALVLGNYLLGGSSSARLPARVREKEGLSYSTYSYFSAELARRGGARSACRRSTRRRTARASSARSARSSRARCAEGFSDAEVEAARKGLLEARAPGAHAGRRPRRPPRHLPLPRPHLRLGHRLREAHRRAHARRGAATRCAGTSTRRSSPSLKAGDFHNEASRTASFFFSRSRISSSSASCRGGAARRRGGRGLLALQAVDQLDDRGRSPRR